MSTTENTQPAAMPIPDAVVEAAARVLASEFSYDNVFEEPSGSTELYDAPYWRALARAVLDAAAEAERARIRGARVITVEA